MITRLLPAILFLVSSYIYSQSNQQLIKENAPGVYITCWFCDLNFIKEQIPIVNYVNDRKDADINILFTSERTGSGGYEYTAIFYGQNMFVGKDDTLKFSSPPNESQNTIRDKTVEAIKLGLINYLAKSTVADKIIISFKMPEEIKTEIEDPWDFWVFRIGLDGYFNGEERSSTMSLYPSVTANRVTEDLKIKFSYSNSYNENNFKYETETGTEKIKSISRENYLSAATIFSIDENWSWGFLENLENSTYYNTDISARISPQIEYNIFPYSESNKKQLRLGYYVSGIYNNYISETIFFKIDELLVSQCEYVALTLIEPWGNTFLSLSATNYLNDFNKYRLNLYASVSWQLFKGFSFDLFGYYNKIRDQISLAKGDASVEEVLLRRRQLETGYNYYVGMGVSYSFGSIYNNIVNPRFGN